MVYVPVTILGGLPVIADVWFSGPDHECEYDAGVNELFWIRDKHFRGAPLSEHMMEKIEKKDSYWQANVTEQANDWLGYNARDEATGELTEEYLMLNPDRRPHDKD